MGTEIYYFSGTGNSLVIARNIAEKTKGTIISIPSVMNKESIESDADVIGIVFPIYYATNDAVFRLSLGDLSRNWKTSVQSTFLQSAHTDTCLVQQ